MARHPLLSGSLRLQETTLRAQDVSPQPGHPEKNTSARLTIDQNGGEGCGEPNQANQ